MLTKNEIDSLWGKWLAARARTIEGIRAQAEIFAEIEKAGLTELIDRIPHQERIFMRNIRSNQMAAGTYFLDGQLRRAVAAMPVEAQESLLQADRKIEVLIMNPAGVPQTLTPHVSEIQPEQVKQVFADGRIRELPEQRMYLEEKLEARRVETFRPEPPAYEIVKGRLLVHKSPLEFTHKQLSELAAQTAGK